LFDVFWQSEAVCHKTKRAKLSQIKSANKKGVKARLQTDVFERYMALSQ
jgi:hypothetical protein